jgi:hypothetical protein
MTEGSMTGRPYGGTNDTDDSGTLPGERPGHGEVDASPEQEPRAAQGGGMSDAGSGGPPDPTGPTG